MESKKNKKTICFVGYPAPYFESFFKKMSLNFNLIIVNQLKSDNLIYSNNFTAYDLSFSSFKTSSENDLKQPLVDPFFDIISRDRYAQRIGSKINIDYYKWVTSRLDSIYKENKVEYLCTWRDTAIQLFSIEVAKINSVKVKIATRMRLPKERIFFCSDINTSSVVKQKISNNDLDEAFKTWDELVRIKPEWKVSARSLIDVFLLLPLHFKVFITYLKKSIYDYGNKYNRYTIFEILLKYIERRYRLIIYKSKEYKFDKKIPKNFIYFGLHTQPESSIDYQGGNFTNQLEFVQNLRRNTPSNIAVVIKVHPTDVDGKSFSYFQKFFDIPGVTTLSYSANSTELIKKSLYIVTITGTAGIEAVCMSKPVVTFAKNYYNMYKGVTYCNSWHEYSKYALSNPIKYSYIENKNIFKNFLDFTFEGEVSRAYGSDPKKLSNSDEIKLSKIYNEICN
jgi:hypothetical protein